jgi:hypothetical protein
MADGVVKSEGNTVLSARRGNFMSTINKSDSPKTRLFRPKQCEVRGENRLDNALYYMIENSKCVSDFTMAQKLRAYPNTSGFCTW